MIVIDEAHYVNQSGRNFRPEFESAVRFLGSLLKFNANVRSSGPDVGNNSER